jgi:hypothetical protein
MAVAYTYTCCQCGTGMNKGYPKDDDEPQFCSKECYDKYLKKYETLSNGILKNSYGGA